MRATLIAAVLTLVAGSAHAQGADALMRAVRPEPATPQVSLKLAAPYAEAFALKSAGIARTSVERRADETTAALGFLCGIQPGEGRTGVAAARGHDPHGRFLGARLSLSFR